MSNHIGENIRTLRLLSKLSQGEFGARFGVSRDNIASYERGAEPKLAFVTAVVNYFHISYHDFLNTRLDTDRLPGTEGSGGASPGRSRKQTAAKGSSITDGAPGDRLVIPLSPLCAAGQTGQTVIQLPASLLGKGNFRCFKVCDTDCFGRDTLYVMCKEMPLDAGELPVPPPQGLIITRGGTCHTGTIEEISVGPGAGYRITGNQKTFTVSRREVSSIWQVVWHINRPEADGADRVQRMETVIGSLQKEIESIKSVLDLK